MEPAIPVTLCELLASPEKYDGRRVVVRARVIADLDLASLGDPRCVDLGPLMLGSYTETANREELDEVFRITRIANFSTTKSFRVNVEATFTGIMHGPGTAHGASMINLEGVKTIRFVKGLWLAPPMPMPH